MSLQPNWPLIFGGEMITVRCDIHRYSELEYFKMDYIDLELEYENAEWEYENTEWEYEWSSPNSDTAQQVMNTGLEAPLCPTVETTGVWES